MSRIAIMQWDRRSQGPSTYSASQSPTVHSGNEPAASPGNGDARLLEARQQADVDISNTLSVLACPPAWVWAVAFGQIATVIRRCRTYVVARIAQWCRCTRSRHEMMAASEGSLPDVCSTGLHAERKKSDRYG
jgi:hypothetical protein